jgi:hypothetical protein
MDPEVDSQSFNSAVCAIWDSSSTDSVAAFVSINYKPLMPVSSDTSDDRLSKSL